MIKGSTPQQHKKTLQVVIITIVIELYLLQHIVTKKSIKIK